MFTYSTKFSPRCRNIFLHYVGSFHINEWGELFGQMRHVWGPVTFLMLFVVSTTIVGLLVLAKPAMLYVSGAKVEGVKFLSYTVGWLCLITIAMLLVQIISS